MCGQQQKYMFTQLLFYAWWRCMSTSTQLTDGKVKWNNLKCPLLMENLRESMEKQLNSSGISFQDLRHCRFFRRSRMICRSGTLNVRNSQIGSSSCQCSTTLIGQEKETMRFVFRIQKKSGRSRRNSRRTHLKESGIPWLRRWYSDSRKQVTQSSQVPVPRVVEFWDCWKEKRPYTSMRMLQTQNSCSESFIMYISSVFTEQFRLGVSNSVWERTRRDKKEFSKNENPWTKKY